MLFVNIVNAYKSCMSECAEFSTKPTGMEIVLVVAQIVPTGKNLTHTLQIFHVLITTVYIEVNINSNFIPVISL